MNDIRVHFCIKNSQFLVKKLAIQSILSDDLILRESPEKLKF